MPKQRYIRFVIGQRDPDSHARSGLFQAAFELLKNKQLTKEQKQAIDEPLDWLCDELDTPKGYGRKHGMRALSWFKPDAHEAIHHARLLATALETHSIPVETIYAQDPGLILYEDQHQLLAVPKRDNAALKRQKL